MLNRVQFIQKSLETHLFWARIMKEHLIFIQAGAVSKDVNLIQQADMLKNAIENILVRAVNLSHGVVTGAAVAAQEFVTNNTLPAEQKTENLSGIPINTEVTKNELALSGNGNYSSQLERAVYDLNQMAIPLSAQIAEFKRILLDAVLTCKIFTWNFPLLIDHIRREALMYNASLRRLQSGMDPHDPALAPQLEAFWNRIMAEHSLFIRQYLDPTEEQLITTANTFANNFKRLTQEAAAANGNEAALENVTEQSLAATRSVRDFKKQGTELILLCRVRSLINPLLADHVTREANHYIRLLNEIRTHI